MTLSRSRYRILCTLSLFVRFSWDFFCNPSCRAGTSILRRRLDLFIIRIDIDNNALTQWHIYAHTGNTLVCPHCMSLVGTLQVDIVVVAILIVFGRQLSIARHISRYLAKLTRLLHFV